LKENKTIAEKLGFRRSLTHKLQPYWTANLKENHYILYTEDNQQVLENGYQDFLKDQTKNKINIKVRGDSYSVNFVAMVQIKIEGGFSRNINRSVV
jgi:hypothetical protein